MLILVGVSVNIALGSGLFSTTQGVAKNTQNAVEDETKLSEGQIQLDDGTWVSLKDYANSFGGGSEVSGPKLTITGPSGSSEYAITADTTFADMITNYPDDFAVKTVTHGFGTSDFVAWNDIFMIATNDPSETSSPGNGLLPYSLMKLMDYKNYSDVIFATGNISDYYELAAGVAHTTLSGYTFNISE